MLSSSCEFVRQTHRHAIIIISSSCQFDKHIIMLSSSCEFDRHIDMLSSCYHHLVSSTNTSSCYHHLVSSTDTSTCCHHLVSYIDTSTCHHHHIIILSCYHHPASLTPRYAPRWHTQDDDCSRNFSMASCPNRVIPSLKSASFEIRISSPVRPSKVVLTRATCNYGMCDVWHEW